MSSSPIAVGAGIAAGSIALIGFGADSFVEAVAGMVIVWLFTGGRGASEAAKRRAQQLIAASFFVLAAYAAAVLLAVRGVDCVGPLVARPCRHGGATRTRGLPPSCTHRTRRQTRVGG
ncbi:MAG: hypothetical protein ACXVRQ_11235 [Gaiellaceae bacterium]